jgi:hypothetical protein
MLTQPSEVGCDAAISNENQAFIHQYSDEKALRRAGEYFFVGIQLLS